MGNFAEIEHKLPPMRAAAYRLLVQHGPATAAELVDAGRLRSVGGRGLGGNMHARLGELIEHGSAEITCERQCRVTGNSAYEYKATDHWQPRPKKEETQSRRDKRLRALHLRIVHAALKYKHRPTAQSQGELFSTVEEYERFTKPPDHEPPPQDEWSWDSIT